MKLCALLLLPLVLESCAATSQGPAASGPVPTSSAPERKIALYLGGRKLDKDQWDPTEEQGVFGVEFSEEPRSERIGFELGLMASRDEATLFGTGVTGSASELYGGIRKTFGQETVHPYLGAGLAFIQGKIEVDGAGSDDDNSLAGYAHAGVDVDLGNSFVLGLDVRALFGSDITLAGVDGDVDYTQVALRLGWRF